MGDYLRERAVEPDLVLCSTAVRARQTLDLLELSDASEVLLERELYGADADDLLARLNAVDDATTSVLVIGHNPCIQEAALLLAAEPNGLNEKFPTAALADLRLAIESWTEVAPGVARLHALVTPKNLA